jgi:RHS repeat-associated protein
VQYTYNEMSGGANNSRLTGIVYPTGSRTVTYDYSGHSGLDNVISRLSKLTQTLGSGTNAVTTTLETYDYLGLATVVRVGHPQTGVDLTYIQQSGDTNAVSDAGDIYTGLDRFGRVSDQNYLNTNSGTSLTSTDRFQYGYDQNSNVMYKNNLVSSSNSELYHANGTNAGYDSLNRLTNFQRGTLASGNTSISGSPSATRNWTLDAQGNWSANADGNSYTVNAQNQYATVTSGACCCCCCSSSGTTLSFAYDNDGNLTSRPTFWCNVPSHADTFTYDAWDREANFTHTESSSVQTLAEQTFNIDALGRRVQVVVTDTGFFAGTAPTDDLYYSTSGQVLEDDNVHTAGGGYNQMQFVWSPTYINDLVLRDHSTAGNGTFDERIYVQHDANHNVTAITNASSGTSLAVLERFVYDPYGAPTVLTSGWASSNDSYNWQYMFQGGRYDQYSGLYSFQAREYDSTLGRWSQQEPFGAAYIDGANLYQAFDGNPSGLVDPKGLDPKVSWGNAGTEPDYTDPTYLAQRAAYEAYLKAQLRQLQDTQAAACSEAEAAAFWNYVKQSPIKYISVNIGGLKYKKLTFTLNAGWDVSRGLFLNADAGVSVPVPGSGGGGSLTSPTYKVELNQADGFTHGLNNGAGASATAGNTSASGWPSGTTSVGAGRVSVGIDSKNFFQKLWQYWFGSSPATGACFRGSPPPPQPPMRRPSGPAQFFDPDFPARLRGAQDWTQWQDQGHITPYIKAWNNGPPPGAGNEDRNYYGGGVRIGF